VVIVGAILIVVAVQLQDAIGILMVIGVEILLTNVGNNLQRVVVMLFLEVNVVGRVTVEGVEHVRLVVIVLVHRAVVKLFLDVSGSLRVGGAKNNSLLHALILLAQEMKTIVTLLRDVSGEILDGVVLILDSEVLVQVAV
jgi:hypothetical protein